LQCGGGFYSVAGVGVILFVTLCSMQRWGDMDAILCSPVGRDG